MSTQAESRDPATRQQNPDLDLRHVRAALKPLLDKLDALETKHGAHERGRAAGDSSGGGGDMNIPLIATRRATDADAEIARLTAELEAARDLQQRAQGRMLEMFRVNEQLRAALNEKLDALWPFALAATNRETVLAAPGEIVPVTLQSCRNASRAYRAGFSVEEPDARQGEQADG